MQALTRRSEYSIPYYCYGIEQYPTKVLVVREWMVQMLNPKRNEIEWLFGKQ